MRPIGYLYKRVAERPEWLKARDVDDIYSLSNCMSEAFADYVEYWQHNGYWLFDSPSVIQALCAAQGIGLEGLKLFYYEAYEEEYLDRTNEWVAFGPEVSFATNVVEPANRVLEGFDVASFSAGTAPGCSPLSCNAGAETLATNAHCLFRTFEEALRAIEQQPRAAWEPGPYRIIAVYSVIDSEPGDQAK